MMGDEDTDFDPGDIETSSRKAGFYANAFDASYNTEAKLRYRQNSEDISEMPYPRPVVQIDKVYKLPSTGRRMGTWIYTVAGAFAIAMALLPHHLLKLS